MILVRSLSTSETSFHVADQPRRRRSLLFVEFALAHELDVREQGFVDEEFAAGAGDFTGVQIDRRFLADCDAVHAGAELGDCPLLARGNDLPELSRLDQAGLSDVPEIDASFLHVLTDVLDGDDGTIIVLFHVEHAHLLAPELENRSCG